LCGISIASSLAGSSQRGEQRLLPASSHLADAPPTASDLLAKHSPNRLFLFLSSLSCLFLIFPPLDTLLLSDRNKKEGKK
jgi:hypothetical protein